MLSSCKPPGVDMLGNLLTLKSASAGQVHIQSMPPLSFCICVSPPLLVCTRVCVCVLCMCVCVYLCICAHVCMHVLFMYAYTSICICVHSHVCAHVYIHGHMCVCACV